MPEARVEAQHVEVMSAAPPGTVRVNAIAVEVMSGEPVAGAGSTIVVTGGRRRRRIVVG